MTRRKGPRPLSERAEALLPKMGDRRATSGNRVTLAPLPMTRVVVRQGATVQPVGAGVASVQVEPGGEVEYPPGALVIDHGAGAFTVIETGTGWNDDLRAGALAALPDACGVHAALVPHSVRLCEGGATARDLAARSVQARAATAYRAGIREIVIVYTCACSLTFDHPYVAEPGDAAGLAFCRQHAGRVDQIQIRGL